ncbi:MAG: esterase-like activity of phytase family protein [Acidimicrobiia bacterium]
MSTFSVYTNNADPAAETVAEIVAASSDGKTLIYTDGSNATLGFVDIADPSSPKPLGTVDLPGEPTSVAVVGRFAVAGVNTSESFINPSGELAVIDITRQRIVTSLDLAGQPDSVTVSPDGKYIAIAIENERDEDVTVDDVEGGLPQAPAGLLQIVDVKGAPRNWDIRDVDMTGLAGYGADDPEPEFVDINTRNQAVVTMQENNHLAIVDLRRGTVTRDFPAGTVTLVGVDAVEDGIISLTDTITDIPREPDAVAWIGTGRFATANEGDLFGGSRGFTVYDMTGRVRYDSGTSFEEIAVAHGHYPEDRSENKGSEPESIEFGRFGATNYLFVGSERGSFVNVYQMRGDQPSFRQLLPTGLSPEGLLAIPGRNLFVASTEADDPEFGVRTTIMIYELVKGAPAYPGIMSVDGPDGTPIPWSAMSGLGADPHDADTLYAVWDSYYSESRVFTIDVSETPAKVVEAITIDGGTGNYDPEGVVVAPDGTMWIASEGNASGSRTNRLLQIDAADSVLAEVELPAEVLACRAASGNRGSLGAGFEGVTVVPSAGGYTLAIAQQRGWDYTTDGCEDLDDDPSGANSGEPGYTRIWTYDPVTGEWGSIAYELEPITTYAAWTGLSEITALEDGSFVLIERDNVTGDWAELKTLVKVTPEAMADGVIERSEKLVYDVLPDMQASNGWITDKPEGFAVAADGQTYLITDNDGVEDWSGETQFLRLGTIDSLFD